MKTENKVTITKQEKMVFDYLNKLRDSGIANMFGATPYIVDRFEDVDDKSARNILSKWMNNFNEDGYDHLLEDDDVTLKDAEKRIDLLKSEMGEIKRVFQSEQSLFIEFENGMNIQLHDREIDYQATEYLESEKQSFDIHDDETQNKQLYREDFTDLKWYEKMKELGENLPNEYSDVFDRHGEIAEKYQDVMTTDIYILNNKK